MDTQFWLQTTGIVLYFTSMWIAGITQGMMWAYDGMVHSLFIYWYS